MERDRGRWDDIKKRADYPHDDCAEHLVLLGRDAELVRVCSVVAVDGPVAKGKEGGEQRIYRVGADEIKNDAPATTATLRRPWPEDAIPEQN